MELLNRVKDRIFNTLGGVTQNVGHFLQDDFNRNPVVQSVNTVRQAIPQVQRQIPQIQEQVQQAIPQVQDTASAWWNDQINRPVAPSLDSLFPGHTPTVKNVADQVIPILQGFPRTIVEAKQTPLIQDILPGPNLSDNLHPQGVVGKAIFGDTPLQSFTNPDRPAATNLRALGTPEPVTKVAAPALAAVFGGLQFVPGEGAGEKAAAEEVAKLASKAKTAEKFTEAVGKSSPEVYATVEKILKDAKNPINTMEQLFQASKKGAPIEEAVVKNLARNAPRKTEELFQATENALKPGNIYKPKGAVKKLFEDTFRSSQGVIERSGDAGKQISALLDAADKQKAFASGFAKNKLRAALKGLQKDEINTFADVVQGYTNPVSERQAQAVKTWGEIAADVLRQSKNVGLDVKERANYFPHQILELSNADKRVMAQEMVDSGRASTVAEALQDLEKQVGALSRTSERRYGNLELPRETNLPYNKSPNALFDYIDNAYGRIADVKHFGKSDETLYELARAAGTQGGDANQITKYLDQILGKHQQGNWSRKLTSLQTVTKLNPVTSAINLTQNLSTWLRTDTGTMLKTMKNIVSSPDNALANAMKVGEVSPNMAKELQDIAGTGNTASKWIRLIGMQGTEKFNRIVSVNAGMEYGQKLARQAAEGSGAALRELERLGIKPSQIKNGVLTDDGLKTIGREVSKSTQFATGAGELPYFWRTNLGKVVTQFKSFAYKQTGFIKNEAVRTVGEATKGNVKPLINALIVFGISAPIAGEIVNDFRSLVRNKKRDDVDSLTERYFSNILAATSFGLLDSTSALFGGYGPQGTISTLGGPTVGDISKGIVAGSDAIQGAQNYDPEKSALENLDPKNTTQRALVKNIPGIGATASNTFIPNAGVDNYIGGVNNSLDKTDNATYKELLASDPEAAAEFKKTNKYEFEDKGFLGLGGEGKVAGATSGDKVSWKTKDGDKRTVSPSTASDPYKKKEEDIKSALSLWESNAPEVKKLSFYKAVGLEPDDIRYAHKTSWGKERKVDYILDKYKDHEELVKQLIKGRTEAITGYRFISDEILDNLYDEGAISKAEKDYLKKVEFNKDGKLSGSSRDQLGSGSGGLSQAKIRSYINKLIALNKVGGGTKTSSLLPKAPKTPSFDTPKIAKSAVRRRGKTSKRWFTT